MEITSMVDPHYTSLYKNQLDVSFNPVALITVCRHPYLGGAATSGMWLQPWQVFRNVLICRSKPRLVVEIDVRLWAEVGTHSAVAPVKLAEAPGTFDSVLVSTGPFLLIQLNRASSYIVHGCKYIECYNLPGKRTNLASGTFELHSIGWVVSQFATVRSELTVHTHGMARLLLNKQSASRFVVYSFVGFVSTAEILEHVDTMESKILQIQEAIFVEGNNDILRIQDQHVKKQLKQLLLKVEKKKLLLYNQAGTMCRERVKRNRERDMQRDGNHAELIGNTKIFFFEVNGEATWLAGLLLEDIKRKRDIGQLESFRVWLFLPKGYKFYKSGGL
ncbi:hypothetical protein Tco_0849818 [Tanacetum coccineum]